MFNIKKDHLIYKLTNFFTFHSELTTTTTTTTTIIIVIIIVILSKLYMFVRVRVRVRMNLVLAKFCEIVLRIFFSRLRGIVCECVCLCSHMFVLICVCLNCKSLRNESNDGEKNSMRSFVCYVIILCWIYALKFFSEHIQLRKCWKKILKVSKLLVVIVLFNDCLRKNKMQSQQQQQQQ